jgi:S1-C subfamily serine protease
MVDTPVGPLNRSLAEQLGHKPNYPSAVVVPETGQPLRPVAWAFFVDGIRRHKGLAGFIAATVDKGLAGFIVAVGVLGVVIGLIAVGTKTGTSNATTEASAPKEASAPQPTEPRKTESERVAPGPAPLSAEALFAKVSPSVVRIQTFNRDSRPLAGGSGFVVSKNGVIATNHHVIQGAQSGKVLFGEGSTESEYEIGRAIAVDVEGDLVLLSTFVSPTEWGKAEEAWVKANPGRAINEFEFTFPFPPLALEANELPRVGTKVYAIGAPLGLTNTLSEGLISGHREVDSSLTLLQTTAPISPGSSGGPLLSENGTVLGITTAFLRGGQNLNLAIPTKRIAKLIAAPPKDLTLAEAGRMGLDLSKQPPKEAPPNDSLKRYELTETDILGMKNVRSSQLSVFGVSLGMTLDEAKTKINEYSSVELMRSEDDGKRWILVDRKSLGGIGVFTWRNNEDGLAEIKVNSNFVRYMIGESKRLLTAEAFTAKAGPVRAFLGSPDQVVNGLGVKTLHLYSDRGITMEASHSAEYIRRNGFIGNGPPPAAGDISMVYLILTR